MEVVWGLEGRTEVCLGSYCFVSCRVVSYCLVLCRVMSCRITSYHIVVVSDAS